MKILVSIVLAAGLIGAPALAQTPDEQQACMNDAFRVCSEFIPDRDRVTACMVQNKSQLGAPCRAVMARYAQPGAASATHSARRAVIRAENARAQAE